MPKAAKIEWLNRAILETKFSKNDTKIITEIAKKLQNNQPLTEVQTKNLVTIQKLMEEKMTTKQVENFRKNLPNAEIGRWLTSKNTQEPAVAMANAGKKFDENFRKISEEKMAKMKTAISKNKAYFLKYKPKQELIYFVKKELDIEVKGQLINSYSIKHILKWHWPNSGDKIPVTMDDIQIIPEIQKNHDNIKISSKPNNKWEPVIIYEKKNWNYYYYLEKVNKNGFLDTQTMYIRETQKKNF